MGFSAGSDSKESACSAGDTGSIPGLRRYPGEGNGNPLQYSCLGNPMDRGAWWATVHGVPKSWTQLSNWHTQGRGASNLLSDLLKTAKLSKRSSTDITLTAVFYVDFWFPWGFTKLWLACAQEDTTLSCFSHVRVFAIPWNVAHQAPLSMGFSRGEYCSGLPFPSPGDFSDPEIKAESLVSCRISRVSKKRCPISVFPEGTLNFLKEHQWYSWVDQDYQWPLL